MHLVYTSIALNYLPQARVLAKSLMQFHPNWHFVLLLSDKLPKDFNVKNEVFDEIVQIEDLGIPNFNKWAFKHSIVELCTAVKGPAAELFLKRKDVERVIYLDPDIKVFSPLTFLDLKFKKYDIILTPHLLDPEKIHSQPTNEIDTLKHGVFNLGFLAVKKSKQGKDFLQWWSSRLQHFCFDESDRGLFVDQKWCNLAPVFFDKLLILKNYGANVASWNLGEREITFRKGRYYANKDPLVFYHFTGFVSGKGKKSTKIFFSNRIIKTLWNDYSNDLFCAGASQNNYDWHYGYYNSGKKISPRARIGYRNSEVMQKIIKNPFSHQFLDNVFVLRLKASSILRFLKKSLSYLNIK
jgi:hypothetical protein